MGRQSQVVAAQLKARGLLPYMAGYHVVFSGLADTAGRTARPPAAPADPLTALWMAVCQASAAASCSVDEMTRPDPPSRSTIPVPVVPVPVVKSVHGRRGTTVTLPDALLFQFNRATLIPAADSVLQPIATRARSQHLLVSITGYASPDGGTDAYNTALSKRRAAAVRDRLIALGLPAAQITKVTGAGTAGEAPGRLPRTRPTGRGHLRAVAPRGRRPVPCSRQPVNPRNRSTS